MTTIKTEKSKPPMKASYLRTHAWIARLADHITFGKIAQISGKELQTAEAWGRRPPSNEYPTGTGRANPIDSVLRLIGHAHKEDPALAREGAEIFTDYVDFLDNKSGSHTGCLNDLIASTVKENAEAIVSLLNCPDPDFHAAFTEIVQAEVALGKLKAWVRDEMKLETLQGAA